MTSQSKWTGGSFLQRRTLLGFIVILMLASMPMMGATTTAARQAGDADDVAVVTDNTFNDACGFEIPQDDGTANYLSCNAGTVIKVEFTSSADVAAAHGVNSGLVIPLTGDGATDEAAINSAVAELHLSGAAGSNPNFDSQTKSAPALQTCTYRRQYSVFGSYGVGGGDVVHYNVTYDVNTNCTITSVSDYAWATNAY